MMYPNGKIVYMITPGEVETDEVLPVLDRLVREESLTLGHIEAPTLTYEEKEEGRFYYVEAKQIL